MADDETVDWHYNHIGDIQQNHTPSFNSNNFINNNEISKKEQLEIRKHNISIRKLAYKEVRRPGKGK